MSSQGSLRSHSLLYCIAILIIHFFAFVYFSASFEKLEKFELVREMVKRVTYVAATIQFVNLKTQKAYNALSDISLSCPFNVSTVPATDADREAVLTVRDQVGGMISSAYSPRLDAMVTVEALERTASNSGVKEEFLAVGMNYMLILIAVIFGSLLAANMLARRRTRRSVVFSRIVIVVGFVLLPICFGLGMCQVLCYIQRKGSVSEWQTDTKRSSVLYGATFEAIRSMDSRVSNAQMIQTFAQVNDLVLAGEGYQVVVVSSPSRKVSPPPHYPEVVEKIFAGANTSSIALNGVIDGVIFAADSMETQNALVLVLREVPPMPSIFDTQFLPGVLLLVLGTILSGVIVLISSFPFESLGKVGQVPLGSSPWDGRLPAAWPYWKILEMVVVVMVVIFSGVMSLSRTTAHLYRIDSLLDYYRERNTVLSEVSVVSSQMANDYVSVLKSGVWQGNYLFSTTFFLTVPQFQEISIFFYVLTICIREQQYFSYSVEAYLNLQSTDRWPLLTNMPHAAAFLDYVSDHLLLTSTRALITQFAKPSSLRLPSTRPTTSQTNFVSTALLSSPEAYEDDNTRIIVAGEQRDAEESPRVMLATAQDPLRKVLQLFQQYDGQFYLAVQQNNMTFLTSGSKPLQDEIIAAVKAMNSTVLTVEGIQSDLDLTNEAMTPYAYIAVGLSEQLVNTATYQQMFSTNRGKMVSEVENEVALWELSRVSKCTYFELSYPWKMFPSFNVLYFALALMALFWLADHLFTPVFFTQLPWNAFWSERSLRRGVEALAVLDRQKEFDDGDFDDDEMNEEMENNNNNTRQGQWNGSNPKDGPRNARCWTGGDAGDKKNSLSMTGKKKKVSLHPTKANDQHAEPLLVAAQFVSKSSEMSTPEGTNSTGDVQHGESSSSRLMVGSRSRISRNATDEYAEAAEVKAQPKKDHIVPDPLPAAASPSKQVKAQRRSSRGHSFSATTAAGKAEKHKGEKSFSKDRQEPHHHHNTSAARDSREQLKTERQEARQKAAREGLISPLPYSPDDIGVLYIQSPYMSPVTSPPRGTPTINPFAASVPLQKGHPIAFHLQKTPSAEANANFRGTPGKELEGNNKQPIRGNRRAYDTVSPSPFLARRAMSVLEGMEQPYPSLPESSYPKRNNLRAFVLSEDYTAPRAVLPVRVRAIKRGVWEMTAFYIVFFLLSLACAVVLQSLSGVENGLATQDGGHVQNTLLPLSNRLGEAVLIDVSLSCWARAYLSLAPDDIKSAIRLTSQWSNLAPIKWADGSAVTDDTRMPPSVMTNLFSSVLSVSKALMYLMQEESVDGVYDDMVKLLDNFTINVQFPGYESCLGNQTLDYLKAVNNVLLCLIHRQDCSVAAIPKLMAIVNQSCMEQLPQHFELYLTRVSALLQIGWKFNNPKEVGDMLDQAVQPIEGDVNALFTTVEGYLSQLGNVSDYVPWVCIAYTILVFPLMLLAFRAAQRVQRAIYFG